MSLSSELTDLTTNLAAAKAAVVTKGGTVGNTGLAGLEAEILSIPAPADRDATYGVLYHYGYHSEWRENYSQGVQVNSIDQTKVEAFALAHNAGGQSMWFGYQGGGWNNCYVGGQQMVVQDMLNEVGVDVTVLAPGSSSTGFTLSPQNVVETSGPITRTVIASLADFNKLVSNNTSSMEGDYVYNVAGGILNKAITRAYVGTSITSLPAKFLMACERMTYIYCGDNVATIGDYALSRCSYLNCPITLPKVASIGKQFLYFDTRLNGEIYMPAVKTIGDQFLSSCLAFNQPMYLPASITAIGSGPFNSMRDMVSTITIECPATVVATSGSSDNNVLSAYGQNTPAYITGITLTGTYASAWHTRFPDRTSPYRKTIVV